jgi:hypothetical protein
MPNVTVRQKVSKGNKSLGMVCLGMVFLSYFLSIFSILSSLSLLSFPSIL